MTEPAAYFPDDLVDEIMPADRARPDDWIVAGANGDAWLDVADAGCPPRQLVDGEIVKFVSRTDYGGGRLEIRADGFSIDPPMPAAANLVGCNELEDVADSVEALVANFRDVEPGLSDCTIFAVSYYTFTDPLPHRFDAATRHFDPVNA